YQAPAITSAVTANAITGLSFTYTLTATGTPAPALAFTGPLPNGITANGTTISGTWNDASPTFNIGLQATNSADNDIKTLVVSVTAQAPAAITSPQTVNGVIVGKPFTYTLTASGNPPPAV